MVFRPYWWNPFSKSACGDQGVTGLKLEFLLPSEVPKVSWQNLPGSLEHHL